jgi:putative transposase
MYGMLPDEPTKHRTRHRYDIPGHAHYLTFSCWRGQPFLSRDRASQWLLESLAEARRVHPFDLWAWVFMPEHAHFLIRPHDGVTVAAVLRSIKQPVGKTSVAWVRKNHPAFLEHMLDMQPGGRRAYRFWQPGGGYDRNIWSPAELREKIHYIHANPVRRGLVESPRDWPWSSYRAWKDGVDEPIRIDRTSLPSLEV